VQRLHEVGIANQTQYWIDNQFNQEEGDKFFQKDYT
jgi:hypothetical protein